jgi:hypothetical protein
MQPRKLYLIDIPEIFRKVSHEEHEEHEEKKNLRALRVLRGSTI